MSADRDELRDIISGWPIGSGYYGTSIGVDDAMELTDAILSSDWLAKVRADAWDEGWKKGYVFSESDRFNDSTIRNPHRCGDGS